MQSHKRIAVFSPMTMLIRKWLQSQQCAAPPCAEDHYIPDFQRMCLNHGCDISSYKICPDQLQLVFMGEITEESLSPSLKSHLSSSGQLVSATPIISQTLANVD